MKKLRNKLKALSIYNSAVCNCHKDSHLTQMIQLFRDGKKSGQDRANYHIKLLNALEDFTQDFLPHMKEEEEVRFLKTSFLYGQNFVFKEFSILTFHTQCFFLLC